MITDTESVDSIRIRTANKRNITYRITEVMRRMGQQSQEICKDYRCSSLKYFTVVSEENRLNVIRDFNSLMYNEQNNYLAILITLLPVNLRRLK